MKLDFNIINKKPSEAKIKKFQEDIKNDIKIKEFTTIEKIAISIWTLVIIATIGIIGIVLLFKTMSIIISIIPIVISILSFMFLFNVRKKIIKKATEDLDLLDIMKKWLDFYEIKSDNVFVENNDFTKKISTNRLSPSDATIEKSSPTYSFKEENGIVTSLKAVQWHWIRRTTDSKGRTVTRHYYLDQIYMFNYNFNKKWDKLSFKLSNDNRLLKIKKIAKNETLENDNFNKKFSYSYNDPIKLRIAFTPYTQELFVNKYIYSNILFSKENDVLITTCDNKKISSDFTPFFYNASIIGMNQEKIKNSIIHDITTDFLYLMKFIGHTRLIPNLFK